MFNNLYFTTCEIANAFENNKKAFSSKIFVERC